MDEKVYFQTLTTLVLIAVINIVLYCFLFVYLEWDTVYSLYFNPILIIVMFIAVWLGTFKSNPSYASFFKKTVKVFIVLFVIWFFISQFLIGLGSGNK